MASWYRCVRGSQYRVINGMKIAESQMIEVVFTIEAQDEDQYSAKMYREKGVDPEEDDEDGVSDTTEPYDSERVVTLSGSCCWDSRKLHELCKRVDSHRGNQKRRFHVREVASSGWLAMERSLRGGTLEELFKWFTSFYEGSSGLDLWTNTYTHEYDELEDPEYVTTWWKRKEFGHLYWIDLCRLATKLDANRMGNKAARMLAGVVWDRTYERWQYLRETPSGTYAELEELQESEDVEMEDADDEDYDEDDEESDEEDAEERIKRISPVEYCVVADLIDEVFYSTNFSDGSDNIRKGQINWGNKRLLKFLLDCLIYKDFSVMKGQQMGPVLVKLLRNGGDLAVVLSVMLFRAGKNDLDDDFHCPWDGDKIIEYLEENEADIESGDEDEADRCPQQEAEAESDEETEDESDEDADMESEHDMGTEYEVEEENESSIPGTLEVVVGL